MPLLFCREGLGEGAGRIGNAKRVQQAAEHQPNCCAEHNTTSEYRIFGGGKSVYYDKYMERYFNLDTGYSVCYNITYR